MKFAVALGFGIADGWLQAMKDPDLLYAEGARPEDDVGRHPLPAGRAAAA